MRRIAAWTMIGVLLLAGCSPAASPGTERAAEAAQVLAEPEASGDLDAAGPVEARPAAHGEIPLPPGVRVIREARLDLEIPEGAFKERWAELRRVTAGLGGYLAQASVTTEAWSEDRVTVGTVTLRVPAERLDEALSRLEELGERRSLELSSQDVSEEYVDLQARLRHWRAVEAFHLRLLEEAATVADALEVHTRLQEVQLSIERIEGRLRLLEDRTTFATLTVTLREAGAPPVAPFPPEQLAEAWSRAGEVALAVVGFLMVAAAGLAPLALVGGGGYLLWRLGRRVVPRGT